MTRNAGTTAALIPGFVFLSLITGGGFATGQEVVQYCLAHGKHAFSFVSVVFVAIVLLTYLTAETARHFQAYDYRTWARAMLPGPSWILLELVYFAMTILVCAIVLSAAASVLGTVSVLPGMFGLLLAAAVSLVLTAIGRRAVIATKLIGALLLALGYLSFAFLVATPATIPELARSSGTPGWLRDALLYVGYNAVAFPAALYTLRDLKSRSQSLAAAVFAGSITVIAFLSVMVAIAAGGPNALKVESPLHYVLQANAASSWQAVYYAVFLWTVVDTAVGMVYAIVVRAEEAARSLRGQELPRRYRWGISALFLAVSGAVAQFGLINLIAKGYGTMAYFFIVVVVGPLLAFGFGFYRRRVIRPVGT